MRLCVAVFPLGNGFSRNAEPFSQLVLRKSCIFAKRVYSVSEISVRHRLHLTKLLYHTLHFFASRQCRTAVELLILPPHHLINHAGIALDDLNDLIGDIFVYIIRHRDTKITVLIHLHRHLHRLKQVVAVDTG